MTNPKNYSLSDVLSEAEAVAADARGLFGHLNAEQLNWKPSEEQWSVGQCLEHLIISNRGFFPQFEAIAAGRKRPSLLERIPGLPGLWGGLLIKMLLPESVRKLKAPKIARPVASSIDPGIVEGFAEHQRELIGKMKALEDADPGRAILTSPLAGFMTYSALDACRIGVVHERRHLAQAERVMASPGFPR
ncbi:MAG: DinB family protein [Blastocatellia bacterium]